MRSMVVQMKNSLSRAAALSLLFVGSMSTSGHAVAPHPSLLEANANSAPRAERIIPDFAHRHDKGICTPDSFMAQTLSNIVSRRTQGGAQSAATQFKILAILVKFSDKNSQVQPTYFDSMIFSANGATIKDYFDEISYGSLDLVTVNAPSTIGWQTAPQTYNYYVQDMNGSNNPDNGLGDYPHNSQKMVEDLVDLVDPLVDFSNYDNDNNGTVDVLLVIHAGSGAELTGSANDMWSHKWGISPRVKDGVSISSFTVQPEYWYNPNDMTIGVYAHELCHGFGLPDLYDTDGSSHGVGKWDIMAVGSWNGPGGLGASPSHPSAWSRIEMGFKTAQNVTSNLINQPIAQVNTGGQIFRLWTSGLMTNEYFLVENRQKIGYDAYIPQGGLFIWHIDDNKSTNQQEWIPGNPGANHYLVALEQADGLFELENGSPSSSGNASDPFPGSLTVRNWNGSTTPNSNSYTTGGTFVAVNDISNSSPVITADLIVGIVAGVDDDAVVPASFALHGNYPNPFNPSTTIAFSLEATAAVRLTIYNLVGQEIRSLVNESRAAGEYQVEWDGKDQQGESVGSGMYLASLEVDSSQQAVKMLLIK